MYDKMDAEFDPQVFFTASVIWGVIGPKNQFSKGQTY